MHGRPPGLGSERAAEAAKRHAGLVVEIRSQDPDVALGERLGQPRPEGGVARAPRRERGGSRPESLRSPNGDDRRRQPPGDRLQDAIVARAGTIDLVHEDERRHLKPLQRSHQQWRLRLHTFDGRNDEHRAVEDAQHPLHLGDEVRVAGRVDQIDGDVVDRERRHCRSDRDPALLLQRKGVGLGRARVDAPDLVDRPGRVEQPLCECRLTGVYMRQDPQVQRFPCHASYPPNR